MSARRPSQFSVGSGPQPPSGTKGKIFQRRGRKPAPSPSSSPDRRVPQLTFSSEQKKPLSSVLIRDEQGQPTTRTLEEMRTRATALRTELRNMANLQIQITDADAERKIHGRGLAARLMDKEEFRMDELKDKDINYILRARQPKDQTEAAFVLDDEDIIMTKMIQIAEEKLKKYRAVRSAITEAAADEIKETTEPVHPTAAKFSGFVEVAKSALANKKWKETIISIGELIQELESQTNQLLHENTLKKVEGEKIMAEFLKRERSIRSEIDRITEELQIANSKNNSAFQKEEVKMQHFREMCTDLNKQIRFIHDDIARKTVQPMVSKDLQNGFEQVKKERETLESQKKEILVLYEREYKKLLERNEKYETDIANTKSGIDDSLRHRKELQAQFDLGKSEILQQSKELVNIKRENARMKELYATSSYTITGSGLRRQGESNRDIVYRNMKLPYPANMLEVPLSPRYPVDPKKHFEEEVNRLKRMITKTSDSIREIQDGIVKEVKLRNDVFLLISDEIEKSKTGRRQEMERDATTPRPESARSSSSAKGKTAPTVTVYDLSAEDRLDCLERILTHGTIREALKDLMRPTSPHQASIPPSPNIEASRLPDGQSLL